MSRCPKDESNQYSHMFHRVKNFHPVFSITHHESHEELGQSIQDAFDSSAAVKNAPSHHKRRETDSQSCRREINRSRTFPSAREYQEQMAAHCFATPDKSSDELLESSFRRGTIHREETMVRPAHLGVLSL